MWAQLMEMRVKSGREQEVPSLLDQVQAIEAPESGLLQTLAMRDQNDPSRVFVLVVFESEEKARAREQDPQRQQAMKPAQALMAELFDGPPEFVDLDVIRQVSN